VTSEALAAFKDPRQAIGLRTPSAGFCLALRVIAAGTTGVNHPRDGTG
jgi:hypothetical protein